MPRILTMFVLLGLVLFVACGEDLITEEQYVEVMKALSVADQSGEPEQAVLDRFGVTLDQLEAFEAEHTPAELAELKGALADNAARDEVRMSEETYTELSVLAAKLAAEGLPPEELQAGLDKEIAARGLTMNDMDQFAAYVTEHPEVQARVEEAVAAALAELGPEAQSQASRSLEAVQ